MIGAIQHLGKRLGKDDFIQESSGYRLPLAVRDGRDRRKIEVRRREALATDFDREVGKGQSDLHLIDLDLRIGADADAKIGAQQEKRTHGDGVPRAHGDDGMRKRQQALGDRRSGLQHLEHFLRLALEDREVEASREHARSAVRTTTALSAAARSSAAPGRAAWGRS